MIGKWSEASLKLFREILIMYFQKNSALVNKTLEIKSVYDEYFNRPVSNTYISLKYNKDWDKIEQNVSVVNICTKYPPKLNTGVSTFNIDPDKHTVTILPIDFISIRNINYEFFGTNADKSGFGIDIDDSQLGEDELTYLRTFNNLSKFFPPVGCFVYPQWYTKDENNRNIIRKDNVDMTDPTSCYVTLRMIDSDDWINSVDKMLAEKDKFDFDNDPCFKRDVKFDITNSIFISNQNDENGVNFN